MTPEQRAAPEISFAVAMKAIERHAEIRAFWMVKAQTLLQLVSRSDRDDMNMARLRTLCADCAKEMP